MSSVHECRDCAALPVDDRPLKPRPTVAGGPRSRRCDTHQREFRKARKKAEHERHVSTTYGLAPGEYEELLAFQGGTCAIPACRAKGKARRLAVDHDHETGEVRGILCSNHNYLLLGRFVNDLQAGLDYLANPPAQSWRRSRLEATA